MDRSADTSRVTCVPDMTVHDRQLLYLQALVGRGITVCVMTKH